jgi:hypothetical protein
MVHKDVVFTILWLNKAIASSIQPAFNTTFQIISPPIIHHFSGGFNIHSKDPIFRVKKTQANSPNEVKYRTPSISNTYYYLLRVFLSKTKLNPTRYSADFRIKYMIMVKATKLTPIRSSCSHNGLAVSPNNLSPPIFIHFYYFQFASMCFFLNSINLEKSFFNI